MHLTCTRTLDDAYYDELKIRTCDESGVVEVSGEQVPTVTIQRSPDAALNQYVPIGTRDASQLTMTVDGIEAELRPGPGKWTRGSYMVELTLAGTYYKFVPNSIATTQLRRNGAKIAEFSMGDDEGDFLMQWLQKRDDSQPADAAIGYALSVAFRTGALGFFSLLVNGTEVLPSP